jgi:hypothetical protein
MQRSLGAARAISAVVLALAGTAAASSAQKKAMSGTRAATVAREVPDT